jgi:hypothetical protein
MKKKIERKKEISLEIKHKAQTGRNYLPSIYPIKYLNLEYL